MIKGAFDQVKGQMGPCGIACAACNLGNGTLAETASSLLELLRFYQVREWAPAVPGGSDLDFDRFESSLEWVAETVGCIGCERGGGPPDCPIRICARERGHELCSQCPDLEGCDRFDWMGEHAEDLKARLSGCQDRSKTELIDDTLEGMGI